MNSNATTEEPSNSDIDLLNEVELGRFIGQGQHSKTWMGSFNDETVTVKIFTEEYKQFWENEKELLVSSLVHANILKVQCNKHFLHQNII